MIVGARYLSVSLGRHTGDERRRWASPLHTADVLPSNAALCASTASPFDRWQPGRSQSRNVRYGVICVPRLPPQAHEVSGAGRMRQSAPVIRADVA